MPDPKQKSRQRHEAKPEIKRPGYTPSSPTGPKWRVGNADRRPEERKDLRTWPGLTGQWRHEGELYHLFINQAGEHIEMILALVESNSQTPWSEEHVLDDGDQRVDDDWDHFRTKNRLFRFGGDQVSAQDHEYALYITQPGALDDKSMQCGSLRCYASSPPEIQLELDYSSLGGLDPEGDERIARLSPFMSSTATQIGHEPNLLDNYLNHHWVLPLVRTQLWFPLTPKQYKKLDTWIFEARVRVNPDNYLLLKQGGQEIDLIGLLEAYLDILQAHSKWFNISSKQERQHLENIAAATDELVDGACALARETPAELGGIDHFQLEWWRVGTLRALSQRRLAADPIAPRTYLTHVQSMVDQAPAANTRQIERWLGLRTHGQHEYEINVDVMPLGLDAKIAEMRLSKTLEEAAERLGDNAKKGLDKGADALFEHSKLGGIKGLRKWFKHLPLGGMAGAITVRKTGKQPYWALCTFMSAGLKLSKATGHSSTIMSTEGESVGGYGMAWRPEHLSGWASLSFYDAAIDHGQQTHGVSVGMIELMGKPGTAKPTGRLSFDLTSWVSNDAVIPQSGGAFDLRSFRGLVTLVAMEGGDVSLDTLGPYPQERVYGSALDDTLLHFAVNGAKLESIAMEALEIMVACELPTLARPGVSLKLTGMTDQPDGEAENLVLSRNRAISVFNYMKNLLEDQLPIDDFGLIPEEKDDLKSFKSEGAIWMPENDHVHIVALGEQPAKDAGGTGKYESKFRRVELCVNGEYVIALGRQADLG